MTTIRPRTQLPPPGFAQNAAQKVRLHQAAEKVKDGFQAAKTELMKLNPAGIHARTHCFPTRPGLFDEKVSIADKLKDLLPPKPSAGEVLSDALYDLRLQNMSPKELFAEEAKQREILEDASTGPIQDADAAAKAEKRLEALEAERERRANKPTLPTFPGVKPLGAPIATPDKGVA